MNSSLAGPIPFVVFGDAPTTSTGLGRIARDLCVQIYRAYIDNYVRAEAKISLVQVGWQPASGAQAWRGPWSLVTFSDTSDWGAAALLRTLRTFDTPGIVFAIWDAARVFEVAPYIKQLGWALWIYPALDAANRNGQIGGPAGAVVQQADRVVAYGSWAAGVYARSGAPLDNLIAGLIGEVAAIPHGISNSLWQPELNRSPDHDPWRIGCVATNQSRKDLPLFFNTIALLRSWGYPAKGWLHTSVPVAHWSIPELGRIAGLSIGGPEADVQVTCTDDRDVPYPDLWLRMMYCRCGVTLGVGRGEGFGYPLVESIACGVPVVHHGMGGGAELVPMAWHAIIDAKTTEGVFALERPVISANNCALVVEGILTTETPDDPAVVSQLANRYRWVEVWPQWEAWIDRGLAGWPERAAAREVARFAAQHGDNK